MNLRDNKIFRIQEIRELTESTFVLKFDRHDLNFVSGQHILIGLDESAELREYSVYSGENDNFLEVLVKEVEEGSVSKQLKKLKVGDPIQVESAVGFFRISKEDLEKKLLFIASGTGIAPFHSFVKSYKELNYTLLHGIRYSAEAYESDTYENHRYISCVSKDKKGVFDGRVTEYLQQNQIDKDTAVYLCGNSDMILECKDLLEEQGISNERIFTEVYF